MFGQVTQLDQALQPLKYQLNLPARPVPIQNLRRRYIVASREHNHALGDFLRLRPGAHLLLTGIAAQAPMSQVLERCSRGTPLRQLE